MAGGNHAFQRLSLLFGGKGSSEDVKNYKGATDSVRADANPVFSSHRPLRGRWDSYQRSGPEGRFDRATLTGLLDRLKRDGLTERRADPEDRRAIRIHLTSKAEALREELTELYHDNNGMFLSLLSREEQEVFERVVTSWKRWILGQTVNQYLIQNKTGG